MTLVALLYCLILQSRKSSACYFWCLNSHELHTNFIMEANTLNPDQTAPKGAEKADDNCCG